MTDRTVIIEAINEDATYSGSCQQPDLDCHCPVIAFRKRDLIIAVKIPLPLS